MSGNNFKSKYPSDQDLQTRNVIGGGFRYLIMKAGHKQHECLLSNIHIRSNEFIIRDDTPGYKKLYYFFRNYAEFELAFKPGTIYKCEEVIIKDRRQCVKFDLDNYTCDEQKLRIHKEIIDGAYDVTGDIFELVECDSSGIDSETGKKKNSCHYIDPNRVFMCASDAMYLSKFIFDRLLPEDKSVFDYKVNKPNQNFRVPGATKNGRTKQIPNGYSNKDLMITCEIGAYHSDHDTREVIGSENLKRIREVRIVNRIEPVYIKPAAALAFDDNHIIDLAAEYIAGHRFRNRKNNTLFFDRIITEAAPHCIICNKNHDTDNTAFLTVNDAGIWFGCIKPNSDDMSRRRLIIDNYSADILTLTPDNIIANGPRKYKETSTHISADVDHILKIFQPHMHGQTFAERTGNYLKFNADPDSNYCRLCKTTEHIGDYAKILITHTGTYYHCDHSCEQEVLTDNKSLKELLHNIRPTSDHAAVFGGASNVHELTTIMPITPAKTIYMRANTGMGKTNAAIEFMRDYKRIVVVSFRKSFTREKLASFNKHFIDDKFVSYESIKGQINLSTHPRIICQVESLHRILKDTVPDLIILDESESIFDEFKSTTMKSGRLCAQVFEWLLLTAECALMMDANIGPRTYEHVRRMRGTEDELLIHNKYQNGRGDQIKLTTNKATLVKQIIDAIIGGQKIIIPTNSRNFAKKIYTKIIGMIPAEQVLLITSNMSDDDKKQLFENIDTEWPKYRVVIYSPTCGAGISFTLPHFDSVYCFFTDNSCTVEACRQMMFRARNISTRTYYVCIDQNNNRGRQYTLNQIRASTQQSANINSSESRALNYTPASFVGGVYIAPKFAEDLLFDIVTYANYIENLTRTHMLQLFIDQCRETGATITELDELDSDEKRAINDELKALDKIIDTADAAMIAAAEDITEEQFIYIKDNTRNSNDVLQVNKFILRSAYSWGHVVDADFVLKYGNSNYRKIYRNLRAIRQGVTDDSSLELIKSRYQRPEFNHDHTYTRHYVANELLRALGFTSITDDKVISAANMKSLMSDSNFRRRILGVNKFLPGKAFNNKRQIQGGKIWEIIDLLRFVNGIFKSMYGFTVKSSTKIDKIKTDYKISHECLGCIFLTSDSKIMPTIISGWNPDGKKW